jgi:hypothetical protein
LRKEPASSLHPGIDEPSLRSALTVELRQKGGGLLAKFDVMKFRVFVAAVMLPAAGARRRWRHQPLSWASW